MGSCLQRGGSVGLVRVVVAVIGSGWMVEWLDAACGGGGLGVCLAAGRGAEDFEDDATSVISGRMQTIIDFNLIRQAIKSPGFCLFQYL